MKFFKQIQQILCSRAGDPDNYIDDGTFRAYNESPEKGTIIFWLLNFAHGPAFTYKTIQLLAEATGSNNIRFEGAIKYCPDWRGDDDKEPAICFVIEDIKFDCKNGEI